MCSFREILHIKNSQTVISLLNVLSAADIWDFLRSDILKQASCYSMCSFREILDNFQTVISLLNVLSTGNFWDISSSDILNQSSRYSMCSLCWMFDWKWLQSYLSRDFTTHQKIQTVISLMNVFSTTNFWGILADFLEILTALCSCGAVVGVVHACWNGRQGARNTASSSWCLVHALTLEWKNKWCFHCSIMK